MEIDIDLQYSFKSPNLHKLINILNEAGDQPRLIGGCVRDALVKKPFHDIDIATTFTPQHITKLFNSKNIKNIPTGLAHGTITVLINNESFEITTLRKDVKTDGRHAVVEFSKDFAADAARRDFTINALSYDLKTNKLYDYFSGLEDLKNKNVIFIGDAKERILEDYLRILRFFRFTAKYANNIDKNTLAICASLKNKLTLISKERTKSEIFKFLFNDQDNIYLPYLADNGFLELIFNSAQYELSFIDQLNKFQRLFKIDNIALIKIFLLYRKNLSNIIIELKNHLKLSNNEFRFLNLIIKYDQLAQKNNLKFFIKKALYYKELEIEFILLIAYINNIFDIADIENINQYIKQLKIQTIPIDGFDLKNYNIANRQLSKIITYLEDKWIDNDFKLSNKQLEELIENYIANYC